MQLATVLISYIQYTRIQTSAASRAPPLVGSLKPLLPSSSFHSRGRYGETLNYPTATYDNNRTQNSSCCFAVTFIFDIDSKQRVLTKRVSDVPYAHKICTP